MIKILIVWYLLFSMVAGAIEFLTDLWERRKVKAFDPSLKPWTVADQQQWELTLDHGQTIPNRRRSKRSRHTCLPAYRR